MKPSLLSKWWIYLLSPQICSHPLVIPRSATLQVDSLPSEPPGKPKYTVTVSSVQFSLSRVWFCDPMDCSTPGLPVHYQLPDFTQTRVHWVKKFHPASSSSVVPFSSYLKSFSVSGSYPVSQLFVSGGQSIGVSDLASVLPKNTQDWCPSEWTGWISLQSKGLSRVFSNTIVQNHQFFSAQLSLWSNSHIHTLLLEKP